MHLSSRAQLITQSIRALLGLVIVLTVLKPSGVLWTVLCVSLALLLMGMSVMVRRGHARAVSWALLTLTTGMVTLSIVLVGFGSHSGTAYGICVVLAGALLGGRAAVQAGGGAILFGTAVLWLQHTGRLPEPQRVLSPLVSWGVLCLSLVTISVLLRQALRTHRVALISDKQGAAEDDETMQKLMLTEKMVRVGQLTSGVTHKFNNMLTVISGASSLLKEDLPESSADAQELLQEIETAVEQASQISFGFRSFSHNHGTATLEVIDAACVLSELSALLTMMLAPTVTVQLHATSPARVFTTQVGLEVLLLHLVSNASTAMPSGGVLTLTAQTSAAGVQLTVSDTGTSTDHSARHTAGTTAMSTILRQLHGVVTAEHTEGSGTRVTLTFPPVPSALQSPNA